jgi:putative addiction module component (TIGR02574 family)
MKLVPAFAAALFVSASASVAQEWKEIPSSFTNSEGFRITGFTARVTGSGCEGSQRYVKVGDPSRKLIEDLWDSIAIDADSLPLPDWHRDEIDRRLDALDKGVSVGAPWEEVRRRIADRS